MPMIQTSRLNTHVTEQGSGETRVLLLHGNVSSGAFFVPLLEHFPDSWSVVIPDLRGYGSSENKPIDATRGLADWADDVWALLEKKGWTQNIHLLGWSMGGGIAMQLCMDHPSAFKSQTLVAPVSPFGFGGTHGINGTANSPDFAGSGGGTVNADFVKAIANRDSSDTQGSPRFVLNNFYFKTGFRIALQLEENLLESMFSTVCGTDNYPGDMQPSSHYPMVAPGTRGVANAFSPKYQNLSAFAAQKHIPVLWVRGAHDQIVSDTSSFDLAFLGSLGIIPGYPGADICPPQAMNSQTKAMLETHGNYREVVFENSGHTPFLEEQQRFMDVFTDFIGT
jgi:pimeloyl-ACP methyl ester carboxylesterase